MTAGGAVLGGVNGVLYSGSTVLLLLLVFPLPLPLPGCLEVSIGDGMGIVEDRVEITRDSLRTVGDC